MTSKGALLIARNNKKIDYVKQSIFLAKRIKHFLDIPVSVITDCPDYLNEINKDLVFDKIITINYDLVHNSRLYYDGSLQYSNDNFKNNSRSLAYDLTPYGETLLLDTDFIISNSRLKDCFKSDCDFLIYKDSSDVAQVRDESEFKKISDVSIDFYWATVIFFRKTKLNKIFFDLVKHIQEEWHHYRRIYQIRSSMFRNDYAFSIAIHMMNGFQHGTFCESLPGKKLYTIDKDILLNINNDKMTFLVEKKDYLGEYTLVKTKAQNVHVMNKFSLDRIINSKGEDV
jgi:hypothetical protein